MHRETVDSNSSSIIWNSDLSYKIKRDFFQAVAVSVLLYRGTTTSLTERLERKELHNKSRAALN